MTGSMWYFLIEKPRSRLTVPIRVQEDCYALDKGRRWKHMQGYLHPRR